MNIALTIRIIDTISLQGDSNNNKGYDTFDER